MAQRVEAAAVGGADLGPAAPGSEKRQRHDRCARWRVHRTSAVAWSGGDTDRTMLATGRGRST